MIAGALQWTDALAAAPALTYGRFLQPTCCCTCAVYW